MINSLNRAIIMTCLLFMASLGHAYKVGLLVVATGKYKIFVPELVATAKQYFLPEHEVTYFIFTDATDLNSQPNMIIIPTEKKQWPYSSMMRSEIYWNHRDALMDYDYVYAIDADIRFADFVGDEILSERVATQHPGYVNKIGTFETNSNSKACVYHHERSKPYVTGAFYGGSLEGFVAITEKMVNNIRTDFNNGVMAVWHDESHLNRCFIDLLPTKLLSPEYYYPEAEILKDNPNGYVRCNGKILTVSKNLAYMRSE